MLASVVLAAILPFLIDDDAPSLTVVTAAPAPSAVSTFPDVVLSDLDGNAVRTASLLGAPLVVNYWFSTCPPCAQEMPAFAAVAEEYAGRVRFVGVNPLDDAATARSFAAAHGVGYELLLDRTGRGVDALGLTRFPTTVLVSPRGQIVARANHELTADELRALIQQGFAT
jgi:thiol-disulfide isomerase/thioredoxin